MLLLLLSLGVATTSTLYIISFWAGRAMRIVVYQYLLIRSIDRNFITLPVSRIGDSIKEIR